MRTKTSSKCQRHCGQVHGLRGKGATVHGPRASFKSWGSDTKQNREAVEMQLAHAVGGKVERAYQRSDLLELRRELIEAWAAHCFGRNPPRKREKSARHPAGASPDSIGQTHDGDQRIKADRGEQGRFTDQILNPATLSWRRVWYNAALVCLTRP